MVLLKGKKPMLFTFKSVSIEYKRDILCQTRLGFELLQKNQITNESVFMVHYKSMTYCLSMSFLYFFKTAKLSHTLDRFRNCV